MTNLNDDVSNEDIYRMLAGELLPSDIRKRRARKAAEEALKDRQREIEAELDRLSTQRLLEMRRRYYKDGGVWRVENDEYRRGHEYGIPATMEEYYEDRAQRQALYAILGRRPHIPNKVEGENKRRRAATAHHGPKKKGGRTIKTQSGHVFHKGGRA